MQDGNKNYGATAITHAWAEAVVEPGG